MKDEFEEFYNPVGVARSWYEWQSDTNIKRLSGFLRDDVLVRTELSMIYGPGGSGKSYLTTYIGICVAMGFNVHTMKTRKGRVLFISEEMPHQVIHARCRLMMPEDAAKNMGDLFSIVCQMGFDFYDQVILSQKKLERVIKETRSDLVFIDALADIHTGEENSNAEMGRVMKSIRAVARTTGACIVVIHHKGKPQADEVDKGHRGASVMKDTCEAQIEVRPIGREGEPRSLVTFKKTRHVIGKSPGQLEFVQEEDPSRLINIANPDEPEVVRPAILFTMSGHMERPSRDDTMVRLVRQEVAALALVHEDGQVPASVLMEKLLKYPNTSKKKIVNLVRRAIALGLIVRLSGGRKVCLPTS